MFFVVCVVPFVLIGALIALSEKDIAPNKKNNIEIELKI